MNTITPQELAGRLKTGATIRLLDVRSPAEYARLHAAGACLIPLDELNPATAASAGLHADEPLYVLCHSGSRAAAACEKLAAMGITTAVRVDGGTVAWQAAALPTVRGSGPAISIERQVRIAAGSLVLLGLLLAWLINPWYAAISAFVGGGLVFAGITDFCGLGLLMAKLPWNRSKVSAACCVQ